MARYMRTDLGRGHSKLGAPQVVNPPIAWYGPGVYLTYPGFAQDRNRRRRTTVTLGPPTVVTPAAVFIAAPVRVTLATQANQPVLNRTARRTITGLGAPVVREPDRFFGPATALAYSRRGVPKPHLAPPAVVAAPFVFISPQTVSLARITPPPTTSHLGPPAVIAGAITFTGPGTLLAPSHKGVTHSRLSPPAVVLTPQAVLGPQINLTYSRRGRPESRLFPPTVIGAAAAFTGPRTLLTYSLRGAPKSLLRPPAVAAAAAVYYGPTVTLAPSRRGRPLSQLFPPVIPPLAEPVRTALAYSRRGAPKSVLHPPAVVAPVLFFGPVESLAPQARGKTRSFLEPPAVVAQPAVVDYRPSVTLAYQSRGEPKSRLEPPAVVGQEPFRGLQTHLTYSKRGAPKSRLEPPVPPETFRGIRVTLARNKPRPVTTRLAAPAVVGQVVYTGPQTNLTYSRRGEPVSRLEPPVVVAQPPAYVPTLPPNLAYSRRGRPISKLRAPTRVFPFIARATDVTLAASHRLSRETVYEVRPPQVVRVPAEIRGPETRLTYSRRGRPTSFLSPPAVVGRIVFTGPQANLAYSRRGRPIYTLRPPRVVRVQVLHPITVQLAAIKPRPTTTLLRPPARVLIPSAGELKVALARIRPPERFWKLRPPAVIGAGIAFFGPTVTLARNKPQPTLTRLPVVIARFRREQGDVCGFDIAAAVVCYLEQPVSRVVGSTAAQSRIVGDDRKAT